VGSRTRGERIAEHLYGERGWTMQRIGEALGVSQATITSDLGRLLVTNKREPTIDKLGRKNSGRPKAPPKPPREPKLN
jgi:plasmid maintenance system antidote protein VapI